MSSLRYLRVLISEPLTAAAEEIFREYEEVDRQRRLLEVVWKPYVKLQRIVIQQKHLLKKEEDLTDQQLCNRERNQEEPVSLQINVDQKEICTSQEQEQLELKQEADTSMLTPDNEESGHMEPEPDSDHQLLLATADSSHCQLTQMPTQTDGKPYSCVTCGKHFVSRSYLTVHIRTHTGEKPFSCTTCGKRFNASTNLTKHIRIHTGEKPYPCSTCGRRFNASPNLKMHMRTHTGEKPYVCNICEKSFTWKATWLDHMRSHQVRNHVQPVGDDWGSQRFEIEYKK